jgi:hypothetical protein
MQKQTVDAVANVLEWVKDVENSIQRRSLCVLPNVLEKCLQFVLSILTQESLWGARDSALCNTGGHSRSPFKVF